MPRRSSPWPTLFFLLVAAAGGAGWFYLVRNTQAKGVPELILKSTDKAVTARTWMGESVADEGGPIGRGTTLNTRNSHKTVFRFGASASVRAAARTEFTYVSAETSGDGAGRQTVATLELAHRPLWLVGTDDVHWLVHASTATVRTDGRTTEVDVLDNGDCTVAVWQGKAELIPSKHPDRAVTVGEMQQASFSAASVLENPHPRGLSEDDKKDEWLSTNLKETMGKEINEKAVSSPGPQK